MTLTEISLREKVIAFAFDHFENEICFFGGQMSGQKIYLHNDGQIG